MKKELLEYMNGERNAIKDEFIVSRERSGTSELVYVTPTEEENPLYQFWHSKKKKAIDKRRAKNTGGRQPYVMILVNMINSLEISPAASKLLLVSMGHMQWGTGLLIDLKSKKTLNQNDLSRLCKLSRKTIISALKELDGIITSSREGYYLSDKIVRKGVGGHADKV